MQRLCFSTTWHCTASCCLWSLSHASCILGNFGAKATPRTLCNRPNVSQQDIAQSIVLPPLTCLLPIVHPAAISSPRNTTHLPDLKENMIHRTMQSSSIAPWFSSDAHMAIVGTVRQLFFYYEKKQNTLNVLALVINEF